MKEVGKLKNEEKNSIGQLARQGIEVKDGKKYSCRFGYPKPPIGYQQTFEDAHGSGDNQIISRSYRVPQVAPSGGVVGFKNMEKQCGPKVLRMLRNNMVVSNHIPEICIIHGANSDCQCVNNQKQLKEYLTKVTVLINPKQFGQILKLISCSFFSMWASLQTPPRTSRK